MFDIGFSELLVIGVVALIVIGPERLPKVARTAGHLFGRLQRYASSVKADIDREVRLDELRQAGESFRNSMNAAKSEVEDVAHTMEDEVKPSAQRVIEAMRVHDPAAAGTAPEPPSDSAPTREAATALSDAGDMAGSTPRTESTAEPAPSANGSPTTSAPG